MAVDSLSKPFDDVDFGSDAKELGDEGTLVATVGARRSTRDRGSRGPARSRTPRPEAAYADAMTRYVIDAPTLVHLIDHELRIDPSSQLVAPSSIRSEALQLLLRDVSEGRRTDTAALETHVRITELKMRLLGDRVSRGTAWRIARERGWDTLRDAEYLAVTRLQADALVTVDPDLAAKADGAVPVAPLRALLNGE